MTEEEKQVWRAAYAASFAVVSHNATRAAHMACRAVQELRVVLLNPDTTEDALMIAQAMEPGVKDEVH